MKVTLTTWAASHFSPPPADRTLRLWVREGRIIPAPVKVGRSYYVDPAARHIAEIDRSTLLSRLQAT